MAAAKTAVPVQIDYGIDAPRELRRLIWRGVILILLGAGLWLMNRTVARPPGAWLCCWRSAALGSDSERPV